MKGVIDWSAVESLNEWAYGACAECGEQCDFFVSPNATYATFADLHNVCRSCVPDHVLALHVLRNL